MFGLDHEAFLGKPTWHLPINLIVQQAGHPDNEGHIKVTGIFQTMMGEQLMHGSDNTHQLVLADAFIRPRLVFESNAFRGDGLAHLAINGFVEREKWLEQGRLIFERE
jgi:hypothetical protein